MRLTLTACAIIAIALPAQAQRGDPFARARADITVFCRSDAACIKRQKSEMGHFVTMMAGFGDTGRNAARRCMTAAKRERHVDWTVATPCMRRATKGKSIGG